MELIGSALGDGVNHAAGRAPVLGGVVRGVDLELAYGVLADHVADARAAALFREEGLVVVAAVNRVVIQQAGDAAKTYQPERAVGNRAGRQDGEVRPAASIGRQVVDRDLVEVGGEVLLLRVDDGRFGGDLDGRRRAADGQQRVDGGDPPDLDDHVLLPEGREAGGADAHRVMAGLKLGDARAAFAVGRARRFFVRLFVVRSHGRAGDDRALRVLGDDADGARDRGLGRDPARAEGEAEK